MSTEITAITTNSSISEKAPLCGTFRLDLMLRCQHVKLQPPFNSDAFHARNSG